MAVKDVYMIPILFRDISDNLTKVLLSLLHGLLEAVYFGPDFFGPDKTLFYHVNIFALKKIGRANGDTGRRANTLK